MANNIRAWHLYIDLLQSTNDSEEVKMAFEHVSETRIATPITILNYTSFLQQSNHFEESFRVFERAIRMFPWPNSYEIWLTYISTFIQVNGGSKLERVRHLVTECLKECPQDKKQIFILMLADFEENFGLLSHAMDAYDLLATTYPDSLQNWEVYLSKVMSFYGAVRCRQVYQKALK